MPAASAASSLVVTPTGEVYQNNTTSVEGQIFRVGITAANRPAGTEAALRLTTAMGDAPNGAPNFINSITGATIQTNVSAPAGQGAPARTTDQILLQPGVYQIQVRLVGQFGAANISNGLSIKCIVNNNEYSLTNNSFDQASATTFNFNDLINITGSAQPVDFTIIPLISNFSSASSATPGTGNSWRSLMIITRLK